ncbi:MAG TPA: hypothetical protein VE690_15220 [Rhodopila sp.]|nr:hypothetical protein [Rhodopila sp.]
MSGHAEKRAGGGALTLLLLGLGCGGLVALSPDIALPLAVLLLPGLIYLMVDHSEGWGVARAVLLFQAAACVRPISDAWYQCSGVDGCMSMLAAPATILWVWLVGGAAWLLTQVLPIGLKLLNDMRLRHYRSALQARREALNAEWGLE